MANLGLEVSGTYAFFLRPERQKEMESYDFITPLAAKGIFESIYWHAGVKYIFDEFRILSPVQMEPVTIRRHSAWGESDQVLRFLALKNVHYLILGHCTFDGNQRVNASVGKVKGIFKSRASKQKAFRTPYFGIPEFTCQYSWVDPASDLSRFTPIKRSGDLGLMLYDLRNENGRVFPRWFHAEIKNGVISMKNITVESGKGTKIVNKGSSDYR